MSRDRSRLDPRAERIVSEVRDREERRQKQFLSILSVISSADSLEYVRRLAAAAKDGLNPGELEWSYTSRLLEHPDIRGFCPACGGGINGKGCEIDLFSENCPAEIGVLKYAGCSADA